MSRIGQDLRYAARSLLRDRGTVALALLALSLGIGAATVIFSVVDSVLIDPLPFKDARSLVHFYIHDMKQSGAGGQFWYPVKEFLDYRAQNHVFSSVMGGGGMDVLCTMGNSTFQVRGALLEPNIPAELGMKPILGRELTESDGEPGSSPVFIMSDSMWGRRFNRDPKVLGTTLTLNGVPRTLVAVMPSRFELNGADVWIPIKITPDLMGDVSGDSPQESLYVWTFARLKPGVNLEQAATDLDVIAHNEAKIYPDRYPKQFRVIVGRFSDRYTSADFRKIIYILLAAVLMLLLIACSNVANLLLARATAREKELAIRAAMGASGRRLVRLFLTESFVLAAVGAVAGCFLAYGGLHWVKASVPADMFPAEVEIRLSGAALLGTLVITVITTLLCGLVPALRAAHGDLHARLAGTGLGVGERHGHGRLRAALVAVQAGLAIVLLVGTGLMMRTFFALERVDLGFDPKNIFAGRVVFPARQYTLPTQKAAFFRQELVRLGALPGVVAASVGAGVPPDWTFTTQLEIPGKTHSETWNSVMDLVSEDYFRAFGLPLVRGAVFSAADVSSGRKVAVINRKFAHDFFGEEDPIGKTAKFDAFDRWDDAPHGAYFEIVGIVGDARNHGLEEAPMPEAFVPYTIDATASRWIFLRTAVPPASLRSAVRQEIWNVDSNVALADRYAGPLDAIFYRNDIAAPEFGLDVLGVFAGIGLTLAAIGVFSVLAYSVSLETRDIGIRMALGAQPDGVLRMVLFKGLKPILAGIIVGLLASWGLTRLMHGIIYGVSAADPWTFAGCVAVLVIVGLSACYLPARRAMRVDPMTALRYE